MSDNDVMQDESSEEVEALEQEATPDQGEVTEQPVAGEADETQAEAEEYEVVERDADPSGEDKEQKKRNAAYAKMRIEKREAERRAAELEKLAKQVEQGDIPDQLKEQFKSDSGMPEQPKIDEYLSEDALAKFDYDRDRAYAAFNQANNRWLIEAQQASTQSQAQEARQRNQYLEQNRRQVETLRRFSKTADELNIAGYEEAESALIETVGTPEVIPAIADTFGEDTKQAVAVTNYLGRNPAEAQRIMQLAQVDINAANRELFKLGYQKLNLVKKQSGPKPDADPGLQGGATSGNDNWKKELGQLLEKDFAAYRSRKKQLEAQLGRQISADELG